MQVDEARALLGFSADSRPSLSEVKAAYRRKVWETHPDLFPADQKTHAESRFKLVSEAYSCLLSGPSGSGASSGVYSRVVRTGVPRANSGRGNHPLIGIPFILIIAGTIGLGGFNATRAYKRQKEAYPSHNPFLP